MSVSGTITIANIKNLLWPGVDMFSVDDDIYEGEWEFCGYHKRKSDKAVEIIPEMQMMPIAQIKQPGGPVALGSMRQLFLSEFYHNYSGIAFQITSQALQDNQYRDVFPRGMGSIKNSCIQYKDGVGASTFNNGFDSSFPVADGKAFYAVDHPTGVNTTYANTFSTPVELQEDTLMEMLLINQKFLAASGLKIPGRDKFLLVPTDQQFVIDEILGSKYRPDTANNAINPIVNMGMLPEGYRVNHFILDQSFSCIINDHDEGLIYYEREPLTTDMEVSTLTTTLTTMGYERFSMGVANPRVSTGARGF